MTDTIAAVLLGTLFGNIVFELGFKKAYRMYAMWQWRREQQKVWASQPEHSLSQSAETLAKSER